MKKYLPFACFWLINSALLFGANTLYPSNVVLGNARFSYFFAGLFSGLLWTSLVWIAKPALTTIGITLAGRYKMLVFYWLANFAAIWIAARVAPLSGLGISRWHWAFGLGLIANILQYASWKLGEFKSVLK